MRRGKVRGELMYATKKPLLLSSTIHESSPRPLLSSDVLLVRVCFELAPLVLLRFTSLVPRFRRLVISQLSMEDQATQQAPFAPYARPQQPTDSPAASLPTETLTRILDLGLQELKPLERQSVRMVFSSVCKHWWSVAPKTDELVVHGSKQAHQLSTALLNEKFAFRQEAIRALVITVCNETSPKASKLLGDLLLSCPFLERLHLTLSRRFSGEFSSLGRGLRDVIASSDTLLELEMHGPTVLGKTSFRQ
jgi:hypothetical protein